MESKNEPQAHENNSQQPTGIPVVPQETNAEPTHGATQNQPKKWYEIFNKPILPQVQWAEVFGAIGVVIGGLVCYIYWNQLHVMSGQLTEMQGSTSQTSQLIVNAAHQAGGIHDLAVAARSQADQATIQAKAARISADAARSAAKTASDSLTVGSRPWIKVKLRIVQPLTFNRPPGPTGTINYTFNQLAGKVPVATLVVEDTLQNVGPTVALNVVSWEDLIPVGFDKNHGIPSFRKAELRQKEWCDANRYRKPSSITGYMIFPNDPWVETSTVGPTMADVANAAAESPVGLTGKVEFVLVGCVCYRSNFEPITSAAHETRFTYSLGKVDSTGAFYGFVFPNGVVSDLQLVTFPSGFSAD